MAIANNDVYRNKVADIESGIYSCAKILIKEKLCAKVFEERALILRNCDTVVKEVTQQRRSDKTVYTIIKIDSVCNTLQLVLSLFASTPSYTVDIMCTLCDKKTTRSFVVAHVDLNIIRNFGVQCLKDALQSPSQIIEKCCAKSTLNQHKIMT